VLPVEYSEGVRPKRLRSPSSATVADGHGELDPAQGLEGFDDRIESPALGLFLQLGLDALHSLMGFIDRPPVLLEDDLLGGGGTDHLGEPAKMCRPPARLPFVADILASRKP
jgi:hypothetical protein